MLSRKIGVVVLAAIVFFSATTKTAKMVSAQDTEPKVVSSDDSKWLVSDAEIFVKFNIKQLMASQLMKKGGIDVIKEAIKANEQANAIIKATGLDVTKDVDALLISGSATAAKDVKALVVVRGNFDKDKLHDAMKKKADTVKLTKEGTTQLYELEVQGQSMYAAFVDKNTIVMTQSKDSTVDAVKNGGKKAATMNKDMKKALARFTGKESMAVALVVNDDLKKMFARAPQVGESASKLQTVTTSLTITDSISFNLNGHTGEEKSAKRLSTQIDLLKAAGAAALAGMENIPAVVGDVLNAVKIEPSKEAVDVNLKITKEMIEKLMKAAGGG